MRPRIVSRWPRCTAARGGDAGRGVEDEGDVKKRTRSAVGAPPPLPKLNCYTSLSRNLGAVRAAAALLLAL